MDPVFDAQYRNLRDSFLSRNVDVRVAYTRSGDVDYLYQEGHLLTFRQEGRDAVDQVARALPGVRAVGETAAAGAAGDGTAGSLVVLSLDDIGRGQMRVPDALEALERELGPDSGALRASGTAPVSPVHVLHISRICPAGEPEVPSMPTDRPFPPPQPLPPHAPARRVKVGVCDTGLLEKLDTTRYDWLEGVVGDPDPLGPELPNGHREIPQYTGHGTFIAGVVRGAAPGADVVVTDHFSSSGGELEHVIIDKLDELISTRRPDIVNLSAGTYCRGDRPPLGFELLRRRWPGVTLVASAGNDATDRPFYPAALDWTVAVGALGPDLQHRAWFSNYGDWVDVYALGEGMINAFATGEYTYQEPPRRPAKQWFQGMARWDGTSFSAPMVAGLIAARCAATGEPAEVATAALLADAQTVDGVGRVLLPGAGALVAG